MTLDLDVEGTHFIRPDTGCWEASVFLEGDSKCLACPFDVCKHDLTQSQMCALLYWCRIKSLVRR